MLENDEEADGGGVGTNAGFVNDADGGGGDEAGDDGALQWRWSIMSDYYCKCGNVYAVRCTEEYAAINVDESRDDRGEE